MLQLKIWMLTWLLPSLSHVHTFHPSSDEEKLYKILSIKHLRDLSVINVNRWAKVMGDNMKND